MAIFDDSENTTPIAEGIVVALKSTIDFSVKSIAINEKTKLESFLDIEEKKMEAQLRLLAEDLAKHTLSFKGKLLRRLRDEIDYLILSNCLEKNAYGGELIADEVISTFSANEKDIRLGEYLERIKTMLDFLPSFSQQQISPQSEKQTEQAKPVKFTQNEYALAYIIDLYADGKQIPTSRVEGGFAKKELIKIGFDLYGLDKVKDSFYKAVKTVRTKFDLNSQQDLEHISKDWLNAVKTLSKNWSKAKKYLIQKKLIGESKGKIP
jgi:hypothetical protein